MEKENLHIRAPKLSEIPLNKTNFKVPLNYFKAIEDSVMAELLSENFPAIINYRTFNTPQNYFDSIEEIVITKLKAEAIYKEIDPIVPINYFNSIEEEVFTKIKKSIKVISFKNKFIKIATPLVIAASLLFLFILNKNVKPITFNSLASSEIENWINNGSIDIDALSVASMYPEIELTNDFYSSSLSDAEVLQYLYEEDLNDLIYDN